MHDTRADELEEEIERVLELVRHARAPDRRVHRARERRVLVRFEQETVREQSVEPRPTGGEG